ncbi:MAG: vWA domain-containing protein [Sarcina sp.]
MKIGNCNVEFLGRENINLEGINSLCNFYNITSCKAEKRFINHHIILIDTSESIKGSLELLKKNIKETLKALKKGTNNYVSILAYGGQGETNIIAKALKCEDASYKVTKIYKNIDEKLVAKGSVIFSEVLANAFEIVKDFEDINLKNSLILFSDGYLATQDNEEMEHINEYIAKLNEKEVYFTSIGMGELYDRSLLSEIANKFELGCFKHISEVKDFYKSIMCEIEKVNNYVSTDICINNHKFFISNESKFYESPKILKYLNVAQTNLVVVVDDFLNINEKQIKGRKKILEEKYRVDFSYSLARYYGRREKVEEMEKAILISKDEYAYNQLINCYSFIEKGKALEFLDELIENKTKRFKFGKIIDAKKYNEPICLLEVLNELINDNECKLLWDYSSRYKRIGVKEHLIEDDYKFLRPNIGFGEVKSINIGERKLNIGIKVKIDGAVQNTSNKLKLDASIYRDYNLVLNGNINTEEICCQLSKKAKSFLKKEKLIKKTIKVYDNDIYVLNLREMKIINNRMLKILGPKEVAKSLYRIETLNCEIWALDKFIKEVFVKLEEENSTKEPLSVEEKKVRKVFRVDSKGIYHPVKVERKITEQYEFYVANIAKWGIEKFPKSKVRKEAVEKYKGLLVGDMAAAYKRVVKKCEELKNEKKTLQNQVNLIRIASKIKEKNIFMWDEIISKKKTETDADLKVNKVIGEAMNVSKKNIDGIVVREESYRILNKYN